MESRIGATLAIAIVLATSPFRAAASSWINPNGGSFHDPLNWLGPVPLALPDGALFDLDASYQVTFDASLQNGGAWVILGDVSFDLLGHEYQVGGLCVGDLCYSGDPMDGSRALTILHGTVDVAGFVDIAAFYGSALLRVSAGASLISPHLALAAGTSGPGGALEVLDGGVVVNTDGAVVGEYQISHGEVLIDGNGSRWIVWQKLILGGDGEAYVRVQNGGFLSTDQTTASDLFTTSGGRGWIEISGVGSTWINASDLLLGAGLEGRLRVDDGGLATTRNAFLGLHSMLFAQSDLWAEGFVQVDGPGALFRVSEAMVLGGYLGEQILNIQPPGEPGGFGRLEVTNGGEVAVGEQLLLRNNAHVGLQGGGLDVGSLATAALPGELRVHESGFLGGTGSIAGSVRLGGQLDPGGASGGPGNGGPWEFSPGPRLLQIEDDFTAEETASLTFDIAGPSVQGPGENYDAVAVTGTAQLGGELVVNVSPSIAGDLGPGDVFSVLTAAGLSGAFANVASGGWIPEASGLGSFRVLYGPGSPYVANVVALTGFGSPACSDGLDNDGDGYTDYPEDPGCRNAEGPIEKTQCQDGINNDFAPGIDFDGGASVNGGVPISTADPQCVGAPWRNREAGTAACGLGFEVAFALLPLALARRRRDSRDSACSLSCHSARLAA